MVVFGWRNDIPVDVELVALDMRPMVGAVRAILARERFLPGVNSDVSEQIKLPRKAFEAIRAPKLARVLFLL